MDQEFIKLKKGSVHNLKDIDLKIPKNKLVVICGISGSGKSSLAFDTIYQEGQRRYLQSLSSYAQQFLGGLEKPEVEKITNLSPTLAINQKSTISSNPRSTVGTITEIYDYLRLLFARAGKPFCPNCNIPISSQTPGEIVKKIFNLSEGSKILIMGPAISQKKGTHRKTIEQIEKMGFRELRIDGIVYGIKEAQGLKLDKNKKHNLEVITGKINLPHQAKKKSSSKTERKAQKKKAKRQKQYIKEQREETLDFVKKALQIGNGVLICRVKPPSSSKKKTRDLTFSKLFSCPQCGFSMPKIEPRLFSFNSPSGACPKCQGLGKKPEIEPDLILSYELSLAEGGVLVGHRLSRFSRRALGASWQKRKLKKLSKKLGFSMHTPLKDLSEEVLNAVLFGHPGYEGIIPKLERVYLKTKSKYVRKEIGKYIVEKECPHCQGTRLRKEARAVKINKKNIAQVANMPIREIRAFFKQWRPKGPSKKIAKPIVKETIKRLEFLENVGVDYISLSRNATTLSVGENQRIRLACQLGGGLSGVIYVLDEPTIGLHQRDIGRLVDSLKELRDLNNTVIVVEHDLSVLKEADWIIEIGPKAGKKGGQIVYQGDFEGLTKSDTITGKYVSGKKKVKTDLPQKQVKKKDHQLSLKGATQFNLKQVNLQIPLNHLVGVAGVSGSGKSTLIIETLAKALLKKIQNRKETPGDFQKLEGAENLTRVVLVDQSPIGRTPRSNPATYVKFFTPIRKLFANTKEAKLRGFTISHFSFNTKAGRCQKCNGEGYKKIEMYFLPDVYVECPICKGKRYPPEILKVKWHQKNIAQVLEMSVKQAEGFFAEIAPVHDRLKLLREIGLGYLQLGQPAPTLSGGEAQRIKLARELSSLKKERTLYILDEPTVGLHFDDIKRLLKILRKLVDQGNSVIIIEHNPEVLKECDWIIEMGPQGGKKGGKIVFNDSPSKLKKAKTHTGKFMRKYFKQY